MEKTFMEAMDFRHACKIFDETKKISDEDMRYILEVGRKSPSSFGQEPWKFLVITNDELRAKIRPICWDQVQITSCSHLVVLLASIEDVKPQSGVVEQRFRRKGEVSQDKFDAYMKRYCDHLKDTLSSDENIFCWTARQVYIAMGNMMTAAAVRGIDSCPIEGWYSKEDIEKVLNLDTKKYRLACIVPFGYRIKPQSKQLRRSFDDVVQFIR